jgi:hypothetical protein
MRDGVETDGKLPHPAGFVINTNRQTGIKLSVDASCPASFSLSLLRSDNKLKAVGHQVILYVD